MRISIVPEIINSRGIQIFDERGMPVSLCETSIFKFTNNFKAPFLLIDNFEKDKYGKSEIKRINLQDVEKFGYRLVSIRTTGKTRWYPGQVKIYLLEQKGKPIPNSEVLSNLPHNHFIEIDTTNNRIRIQGKCAGYPHIRNEIASRWIDL